MISVSEATRLIQEQLYGPAIEQVKIEDAIGRVLAETIKADRDFPPFDRVAMDGIAVKYKAIEEGWQGFRVEGLQPAGQPRLTLKNDKNCIEVMTGAMLPIGCDTVIRYEDVTVVNDLAKLKVKAVTEGQCIHTRAQDAKRGDTLLTPGTRISTSEVALLASVGWLEAKVYKFPKTAIVSTGNELVDIHDRPLPHQIRRSNTYALLGALKALGCPANLFHLTDERNAMERELEKVFASHELIILSGGVSKGKFDFVPAVLQSLGVKNIFHQVSQKPGKPFWFGATAKQIVFALPGNPVSSFLCFYRYIRPWLLKIMDVAQPASSAVLAADYELKPDLTYFLQVRIVNSDGKLMAHPAPGGGSGDFANLKEVDGFLELNASSGSAKAGSSFPYIPFREVH
ncbi:MAG: molybdopterin molybdotransferase MoeA [Cytophagales bacterium]|nr:molybdopterin molybdotransferase MoeA [Cytophagales bacterium]